MKNSVTRLLDIMARLRDPETGCPWDLKQDFASIVPYTIEEAYEVADAIDQEDWDELRAELGDLLFQIAFYTQMAKEKQYFVFADVVDGICEKMIRRHPHVFADAEYEDEQQLRQAWEQHKQEERYTKPGSQESQMDGVAQALPALMRAEKLQKRAARVGFDWPDVSGAMEKTHEELAEAEEAIAGADEHHIEEELGDLLFAVTNVVRLSGLDVEKTLRKANDKFEKRFRSLEQVLHDEGHQDLSKLSLETLDQAWDRVKGLEKGA